jgi:hypothetical protein
LMRVARIFLGLCVRRDKMLSAHRTQNEVRIWNEKNNTRKQGRKRKLECAR